MADILLVYYSRSGNTRKVALTLAAELQCDLEEITEAGDRSGPLGYLRSILQALRKTATPISPPKQNLSRYQLVVIGTPVWAGSVAAPVRAYLAQCHGRLPSVAFFCTMGGRGAEGAFAQMEELARQAPRQCLKLTEAEVRSGSFVARTRTFARALQAGNIHERPAVPGQAA